jgi:nucleoside-diphosphate-sugar epimerase
MALHTLLGANGTIATELVPILQANNEKIRLLSRNPKPVAGAETRTADVLNRQQVTDAVAGSDIVYLLVGIQYDHKIWKANWPVIMRNTIDACKAANAKLIFFDNIYAYGLVKGKITESTPFHPASKKGEVRAAVDQMLLDEMHAGKINAVIAKATDFYGPRSTDKSAAGILVFDRLKKGGTAQWMANADLPRSFNYTPDAARGLYILATHEESFGQTWHLPVSSPDLTGRQFIAIAAKHMNGKNKVQVLPKWMLKIVGWFSPLIRESNEMLYQYEYPLQFDSAKFEKAFHFKPTSYEEGIRATAEWFLSHK